MAANSFKIIGHAHNTWKGGVLWAYLSSFVTIDHADIQINAYMCVCLCGHEWLCVWGFGGMLGFEGLRRGQAPSGPSLSESTDKQVHTTRVI